MTGIFTKQNDTWRPIKCPATNVDGVWYPIRSVFHRNNGQWHKIWQFEAEIITLPVNFETRQEIHDVCACAA